MCASCSASSAINTTLHIPTEVILSCIIWFNRMLFCLMALVVVSQVLSQLIWCQTKLPCQTTNTLKNKRSVTLKEIDWRFIAQNKQHNVANNQWKTMKIWRQQYCLHQQAVTILVATTSIRTLNSLHPNINMHILQTVLCTFLWVLTENFLKQSRTSFACDF